MNNCDNARRRFLKQSVKAASTGVLVSKAPYVFAKKQTTVRILGTHVTLQEELRQRAMKELGINLEFYPGGSARVLQKAAASPESFDLYEQWSDSINILWQAGAIQPLDTRRLTYWDEINSLSKQGKIAPEISVAPGDAPNKILFVQPDGNLGPTPTNQISFMPYVHNVDSFGYNTNFIPAGEAYQTESWAWLLSEEFKGKAGLVNAPTIGLFDAALAAQASGLMSFNDMGNLSIAELDQLFDILIRKKQQGHFGGLWTSVPQSVDFMEKQRVHIQSMFSPAVSACRGKGIPVIYAAPKEGYRAWHGVMCMSAKTQGYVKDAAYEYMNWWLSGFPGAFIARQGYYISNPQRSREQMSDNEWAYWYQGKPTTNPLTGTDGKISVAAGEVRHGGSYVKRLSNIAVWNTVIPNYDYSLDRWHEFLIA